MGWYALAVPLVGGAYGLGFIAVDLYHLVKHGNSVFSVGSIAMMPPPLPRFGSSTVRADSL